MTEIVVLVTGGREYKDQALVFKVLDLMHGKHGIKLIIEGGARGADHLARLWAKSRDVPLRTFPADWKVHGKRAGPIRNGQMLKEGHPDWVIAFEGGSGTADMLSQAWKAGVRTFSTWKHLGRINSQFA